ncbi:hypothetical protein V8E52_002089 [Russula decolorans]
MSVNIFNEEAAEEKADNARLSSFVGALAVGDLVKSTLGPKGMNKILQSVSSGDTNVTNDGVPILKATQLDNADAADDTSSTLSFLHASRAAFFLRQIERLASDASAKAHLKITSNIK